MAASVRLGEYELLCEIGSGGMATLYVARQLGAANVERLVAVKRVHRHVLAAPGIQTMFRDEARLAALIRHPNVVRVLDVVDCDGELLIVLDYLESVSLSALRSAAHAAGEHLPINIVSRVVADALAGLHAAHEACDLRGNPLGIVHRDFSPQNVLVGLDGVSHLIDFGVAKAAVRATHTDSGVLKGKFQYMSPEQARGDGVDRRSDVFAAGIVLFEAMTGTLPFGDSSSEPASVLLRIMLDPVPAVSSLADGIPPALDAVVERALERARGERYQTAGELREALIAAVPPATAEEVGAVVARWCREPLAMRRARILEALAGSDPTLVATPTAGAPLAMAPTMVAAPSASAPSSETPTIPNRQAAAADTARPTTAPVSSRRARAAIAIGAGAAFAGVLAIGVSGAGRSRGHSPSMASDGRGDAGNAHDATIASAPTPILVVDAAALDAASLDAPPADAPPELRPHVGTKPKPIAAAPGTRPPAAMPADRASTPAPAHIADGALIVGEHRVRAHVKRLANTTEISDDLLDRASEELTPYVLQYYRLGIATLAADETLPRGTVTATYSLQNNAFMPLPQYESTIADQRTSQAIESSMISIVGRALKAAKKIANGRIVLATDITVE